MKKLLPFVGLMVSASALASDLEEIIVTASPLGQSADALVAGINRVSAEDLRLKAAANLADALAMQPGVASATFGPGVGAPVIRGQSGPRVTFARDGQPVMDVSGFGADHALADEIFHADAIEVLRGPSALRFGPGAIGGVVNLVNTAVDAQSDFSGKLDASYNDNNDGIVGSAEFTAKQNNFSAQVGVTFRDFNDIAIPGLADRDVDDADETTNGFLGNSASEQQSYWSALSWNGDGWTASLRVDDTSNTYGIPFGAHEHAHEHGHEDDHDDHDDHGHDDHDDHEHGHEDERVYIDMGKQLVSGKLDLQSPVDGLHSLTVTTDFTRYEHTEIENIDGVDERGTRFDRDAASLRAEAVHTLLPGRGYLGVEWRTSDFSAVGEEAYVPASDETLAALYLVQHLELGAGDLEVGLRTDSQRIDSAGTGELDHQLLSLGVSYLQDLNDSIQVGLALNRSQRAPSATEMLAEGVHIASNRYEIGDSSLDEETNRGLELSLRYNGPVALRLNAFHNRFDGYIYAQDSGLLFNEELAEDDGLSGLAACTTEAGFDHAEEAEEAVQCSPYMQRDARFYGFEASVTAALTDQLTFVVWNDFTDARFESGDYVPRVAPRRIGVDLAYQQNQWTWSLNALRASAQTRTAPGESATDGYFRMDSSLTWQMDELQLFVLGRNLTNQEIRLASSFVKDLAPEPGRSVIVGASYRF